MYIQKCLYTNNLHTWTIDKYMGKCTFYMKRMVKLYLLQIQTLRGPFDRSKVWPDSGCWRAVRRTSPAVTHDHRSDSFGDLCQGKPCHVWGLLSYGVGSHGFSIQLYAWILQYPVSKFGGLTHMHHGRSKGLTFIAGWGQSQLLLLIWRTRS